MATYNTTNTANAAADVLCSSSIAATATFLVPSTTTTPVSVTGVSGIGGTQLSTTPLQLETFGAIPGHTQFANPLQHHHQQQHQQTNSSTSSYTFVQIKREPCQVSEISSNNCNLQQQQTHHHHQQHHHQTASSSLCATGVGTVSSSSVTASASSKTMSSSTLTTLVKIEAASPKVHQQQHHQHHQHHHDMDKQHSLNAAALATTVVPPVVANTSNSVPIGIAVARKRPQESSSATLNTTTASLPMQQQQQSLNKDMNCYGIRVADLGGVGTGCGNIYFTGNGDLMASSATADELALSAAGVQNVNRAPSTFWQYQNALPIESVISMSPATVGLQYSREANRGQVVLLPAAPAALAYQGISNFPICTPTDPFQQAAAAAAFVWPSAYINQATAATTPAAAAAAAAAALQPPPNFIFPSMGTHSTLNATPSYATPLQLYLAAAAGGSSLCQHTNSSTSTTNSINLSLSNATSSCTSSSTSSRFLSLASAAAQVAGAIPTTNGGGGSVMNDLLSKHQMTSKQQLAPVAPLLLPPTAMKIEEFNATEFKHTTLATHQFPPPQTTALNFDTRDNKTTTTMTATSNVLELQPNMTQQALNLVRLPTPPTSMTMNSLSHHQPPQQILFQTSHASPAQTPALLNLSTTAVPTPTSMGSPTPAPCNDDGGALNFKTTSLPLTNPQIVVGVPRTTPALTSGPAPQMQDVNIQTDTPICSEDENSSCPLAAANAGLPLHLHQMPTSEQIQESLQENTEMQQEYDMPQQPLELTKPPSSEFVNECHNTSLPSTHQQYEMHQQQQQQQHQHLHHQTSQQHHHHHHHEPQPEDLTGLELLSNISTITAAPFVRVKQEPVEHAMELRVDAPQQPPPPPPQPLPQLPVVMQQPPTMEMLPPVEPLGGLNLLCALAEQRIHEEEEVQGSLFATPSTRTPTPPTPPPLPQPPPPPPVASIAPNVPQPTTMGPSCFAFLPQTLSPPSFRLEPQTQTQQTNSLASSFPSMEGIELPSTSGTSGAGGGDHSNVSTPMKRKKHKHSKSSSSASDSRKSTQRCSKKNKKKRKHKQGGSSSVADPEELDMNNEELQAELRSALGAMDPNFKRLGQWPNPQQLFDIMESNMRMRLADITRQYRKKKRKLDEMSKHKKKKKCSKLAAQQQQQQQQHHQQSTPQLSLTSALSSLHTSSALGTSSPLRDYKFSTFSMSSNGPSANGLGLSSTTSPLLHPSSFLRFQDKTHAFPPPPTALAAMSSKTTNNGNDATPSTSTTTSFVRLEPSSLDAANNNRDRDRDRDRDRGLSSSTSGIIGNTLGNGLVSSSSTLSTSAVATATATATTVNTRHAHKRLLSSADKSSQKLANKERKLMATRATTPLTTTTTITNTQQQQHHQQQQQQQQQKQQQSNNHSRGRCASNRSSVDTKPNPMDKELQLTSEHLYRNETRVLTDMGGLFYAGVMKPLQPPDVYAITLDGERGNKSHIMSREEIFKDTILEVAPKSVDDVPYGTRLCAYWSQQYRCLYPGKAIEAEPLEGDTIMRDFVSVEFDDGDSGRIRLKNIRLLLSDYPIVEYNDNPLYSLGKQKKTVIKSDEHNNSLSGDDHHSHHGFALSSDNTTSLVATMELFTKRSEKKRLKKSLKKKVQNGTSANGGASNISQENGDGAGGGQQGAGGIDINRKHHKHKKRKKHKKHHRKAAAEAEGQQSYKITKKVSSKVFDGKRELEAREQQRVCDDDDDDVNDEDDDDNNNENEQMNEDNGDDEELNEQETEMMMMETTTTTTSSNTQQRIATTIKMETHHQMAATAAAATATVASLGIKVKTEQMDMEEETTSNMMSEISDEAKGDDVVEHNNAKGSSKIAAFLPERQLWGWFGTAYRKAGVKGRARKQFYKTIKRGKETISVGESAVFLSTGRPDRPYIGRIESMWETTTGNKVVRVRWFYHPEETTGCPNLKYPGALFESPHEDENDVQTISHRCEVLEFLSYFNKFGDDSKQYQSIYDNNDTYYLAGFYNPRLLVLKLQDDIPTLQELQNTTE